MEALHLVVIPFLTLKNRVDAKDSINNSSDYIPTSGNLTEEVTIFLPCYMSKN